MREDDSRRMGKGLPGVVSFLLGFGLALGFGWGVFPRLLFSGKLQPLNFLHSVHQDSECEDCHFTRNDGTFSGIPKIAKCSECHEEQIGDSREEQILVEKYIQQSKEIPWLVYSWQPDNVYFSHIAHNHIECTRCHRDVMKDKKLPVYEQNRLTGYSKQTMKMVRCEKCHAERGVSNSCNICHK